MMKRLWLVLLCILFVSCAGIQRKDNLFKPDTEKPKVYSKYGLPLFKDYTSVFAKSGLNVDADSNDAMDITYGGTNEVTAAAAADVFGAAMTAIGAAAILDVADSVTAGDSYTNTSCTSDDDTPDELFACYDTQFGNTIGSVVEDTTPQLGGPLDLNGHLWYEGTETAFTDANAPTPDLATAKQIIKFTDDGTTDVDTITGFSNITTGAVYYVTFVDAYWKVQFSSGNLKGHGGNDWEPRAGDSMTMWTTDGTTINCIISMPTALGVTQYYEMPFDSTPASDDSWSGPTAEFENGSGGALAQWDLVYLRADGAGQEGALYGWDADLATYKYYKPIGVVVESGGIADGAVGTVGILWGIARNDGWTAIADNTDEGKTVYGTATAGVISDTAPSVTGDVVCAVGIALDDDEIQFNFGLCASVEVP